MECAIVYMRLNEPHKFLTREAINEKGKTPTALHEININKASKNMLKQVDPHHGMGLPMLLKMA